MTDKIEVNGTESSKPQPPAHSMGKGILAVFQGSPREKVGGSGVADFFRVSQIGSSVGKESTSNAGDNLWVWKMRWRRDRLPTPVFLGFPCGSAGKESACNAGDLIRSLSWEDPLENGTATYSSILAWRIPWTVQSMGSTKSQTRLSDFHLQE